MRYLRSTGGQMTLLAVLLLTVLLGGLVVTLVMNGLTTSHGQESITRRRGRATAEEALAFAINRLSLPGNWPNPPAALGFDGITISTGTTGVRYRISCSTGPASYQRTLIVTSLADFSTRPSYSLRAYISRRGISASLPNGLSAATAVTLARAPQTPGTFQAYWGPIMLLDTANNWTLSGPLDTDRFPRKFSLLGITGTAFARSPNDQPPNSDGKEYWAFAGLGFNPPIDEDRYRGLAAVSNIPTPPTCPACTATPPTSGNFNIVNDTAVFTNTYTAGQSLYINGCARFGLSSFDFKGADTTVSFSSGMVITKNLTIDPTTGPKFSQNQGGWVVNNMRVPPDAQKDQPYMAATTFTSWLGSCVGKNTCSGETAFSQVNGISPNKGRLHYRGFLWVKGDMIVKNGNKFYMAGVLRVDGTLTVEPGAELVVFHDDQINRSIPTLSFELQTDQLDDVPTR